MSFKAITPSQMELFVSAIKGGHYNLLLGTGASMDSENDFGRIPSAAKYTQELCTLKGVTAPYGLQRIFSTLSKEEVEVHVTERFRECKPGPTVLAIAGFVWKRIFTWNVDDCLAKAYKTKGARQNLKPLHFKDDYVEASNANDVMCVHLHGMTTAAEQGYVFSRAAYIDQIKSHNHWMTVLSQFMQSEPIIITGTSLDEVT